jgi:hypothetical protein
MLERMADRIIERLDQIDGDPDLEEGEDLEPEPDGAEQEYPLMPVYGIDQSEGPINEVAAHKAYLRLVLTD